MSDQESMKPDFSLPPAMAAKIEQMWQKNKGLVADRLQILQRAANELSETRTLDADLRLEATETAHKLAGSLGMFDHMEATEVARRIETDLEAPGLPQPERLQADVDTLCASLKSALES